MNDAEMAFLVGDRVKLRGLRREDMQLYQRWLDNPDVTAFMESGWKPASEGDLDELYRISTEAQDTVAFAVIDKKTGNPVGCCGLYVIQWICRRADFRIIIGVPEAWNKGLGGEAAQLTIAYGFDKLNLETIYLGVNTANERAIRSYEKAGFVREGIRRKLIYRNGRYYDALMMSILREEYFARKARSA
ncbi:MAG: GNAT family protein [Pseudorhodoplanes sp.]|nr:GNAT family protein [Pseudorhodoplanes sp.]